MSSAVAIRCSGMPSWRSARGRRRRRPAAHLGVDPAGRDAVDRDPGGALAGQRLDQRDHRPLGGRVVGVEALPALARGAPDQDHPAAGAHQAERGPRGEEDRVEVGGHRPRQRPSLISRSGTSSTGQIPALPRTVEPARSGAGHCSKDPRPRPPRDPRGRPPTANPFRAQAADLRRHRLGVGLPGVVADPDIGAAAGEEQRRGPPDAARAAGDEAPPVVRRGASAASRSRCSSYPAPRRRRSGAPPPSGSPGSGWSRRGHHEGLVARARPGRRPPCRGSRPPAPPCARAARQRGAGWGSFRWCCGAPAHRPVGRAPRPAGRRPARSRGRCRRPVSSEVSVVRATAANGRRSAGSGPRTRWPGAARRRRCRRCRRRRSSRPRAACGDTSAAIASACPARAVVASASRASSRSPAAMCASLTRRSPWQMPELGHQTRLASRAAATGCSVPSARIAAGLTVEQQVAPGRRRRAGCRSSRGVASVRSSPWLSAARMSASPSASSARARLPRPRVEEQRGRVDLHHRPDRAPPAHRLGRAAGVPLRMREHRDEPELDDVGQRRRGRLERHHPWKLHQHVAGARERDLARLRLAGSGADGRA